ncbi:MAG: MFS transporter [Alkalispirochaeta sp.]
MRIHNERLSLVYVSLAMITVGTLLAETGASLSLMVRHLGLSEAQQGSLVSARFFGGVIFGLVLWVRATTIPLGRWMQGTVVLTLATAPLLLVDSYLAAYTGALVRGFTAGFVIPAAGVYAASQTRWNAGMIAGIANAALSGGLVLVSVVALGISTAEWARWELYWALGPILAIPTLVVGALGGADIAPIPAVATDSLRSVGERVRNLFAGTTWPFAAAAFFIVGTESIFFGLVPRLSAILASSRAASEAGWVWTTEEYALTVMVGVFVGRVVGSYLLKHFKPRLVLAVSMGAMGAAGATWATLPAPAIAAAVLGFGLATANLFPALIGAVSNALKSDAPTTVAAMGWTGASGGTVIPPLVGILLAVGLPVPWMGLVAVVPALVAVTVSVLMLAERRESRERAADR